MELKQHENLLQLAQIDEPDRIFENIKSEINNHLHAAIGLGKRMPEPQELDLKNALRLQKDLLNRVIEIYGKNGHLSENPERLLKVCQYAADDEFFGQTGIESEQLEIYIFNNKNKIDEVGSNRSNSYDYM